MDSLKPYIGSYMDTSVFLNHGKYGYYLNYNNKLYGVPKCFEKPTFKLNDAIKIIEFKKKWFEQQKDKAVLSTAEYKKDFQEDDIIKQLESLPLWSEAPNKEPNGVSEDGVYNIVNKIKSKKKF